MGLREAEKRILELAERGGGTEDMMERLAQREEEHGRIEEADRLGSRKVKSTKVEKDSSKRSWQWRDGAWWLKVECGRLNSRQRREVRRSARHTRDEEGGEHAERDLEGWASGTSVDEV